jgi:transposase
MRYCLAIDIAGTKSMYLLIDESGEIHLEPTEYDHNRSSFKCVLTQLSKLKTKNICIIMESTSIYHLPVLRFFRENTDYEIIVINPIITKNNKTNLRRTKTDKTDCFSLSKVFFQNNYNEQRLFDDIYFEMQILSRQIEHLKCGQIRTKNRFKQLLSLTFPEYKDIFRGNTIYAPTALNFIKHYPHSEMVRYKNIDTLAHCLSKAYNRSYKRYIKKANCIKQIAKNSYPAVNTNSETTYCLVEITMKIQRQNSELSNLKERLVALAKQTELFEIFASYPGIGDYTAAALIAELKDIRSFLIIKS